MERLKSLSEDERKTKERKGNWGKAYEIEVQMYFYKMYSISPYAPLHLDRKS